MGKNTLTSKIHDKLKAVEAKRADLIGDVKKLHSEGLEKHKIAVSHSDKLAKQLLKNPTDKKLQNEYATTIASRDMFSSSVTMNQAIMEDYETTD